MINIAKRFMSSEIGYSNNIKKINSILQYASDIHLEKGFKKYIKDEKPYLVLCGDIGYVEEETYKNFLFDVSNRFDKVFLISGNHEYDNVTRNCRGNFQKTQENIRKLDTDIENLCSMRNNIFFLQKKTHKLLDNENLYITGCTFWATLPKSKYVLHLEHKKWLENTLDKNKENNYVVATHHAPMLECLHRKYHHDTYNYFATDQTEILKRQNLLCWIYGHTHINKNQIIHGKWLFTNQC